MIQLLTKLFGTRNERVLKAYTPWVERINEFESTMEPLSDEELAAKTKEYQERFEQGETLDDLLPEAFATVREASRRVLNMRHFDMQMVGGMILHEGNVAEMKTGEGKTLVATLAVYLNALSGQGVHVVTVNDYLAARDAEWMGQLYRFLGLSVGVITNGIASEDRRAAYASDITYGTNNEFGFDYLRDNMAMREDDLVQIKKHNFAIVDEVDSILIDESRTPLIISGPAEQAGELYQAAHAIVLTLDETDYEKDEKSRTVGFTEEGMEILDQKLRDENLLESGELFDVENVNLVHALTQALRANMLFTCEVDYIVHEGNVVIIDEFTGRMMAGRRFSDGLHQALEAKEGVEIQPENQTLASITFQNFFRMYSKLAGMTGTAMTEAEELHKIYDLEVISVPTNQDQIRDDRTDLIYRDQDDKYNAIIEDIAANHEAGRPVLVGTTSIEKSEFLSKELETRKVKHKVLNAKQHEQEAEIVAQAGKKGAVTIATNMAGRGTDIVLGGNPTMLAAQLPNSLSKKDHAAKALEIEQTCKAEHNEVVTLGGLHILGTERHESRRIDNQLRGRSGRQGDPGSSRFYLSLEDDLMRIFGGDKMQSMLRKMGFEEGHAIEHPWVTKAIENSQKKVEGRNFDIRKQLLEFDDVMNHQREVIYIQRRELLEAEDVSDVIEEMRDDYIHQLCGLHLGGHPDAWDIDALKEELLDLVGTELPIDDWLAEGEQTAETISEKIIEAMKVLMLEKEELAGSQMMRDFEKYLLLQVLDNFWKEHLLAMDHLKQGIHLRGYAQKQPIQEYKQEAFHLFGGLLDQVRKQTMRLMHNVQVENKPEEQKPQAPASDVKYQHESASAVAAADIPVATGTYQRDSPKVGRNDRCPCGSGKKFKHCHGNSRIAA